MNNNTLYQICKLLGKGKSSFRRDVFTTIQWKNASDLCFTMNHGKTEMSLFIKGDSGITRARSTERQR